jgi:hypothetical protein
MELARRALEDRRDPRMKKTILLVEADEPVARHPERPDEIRADPQVAFAVLREGVDRAADPLRFRVAVEA